MLAQVILPHSGKQNALNKATFVSKVAHTSRFVGRDVPGVGVAFQFTEMGSHDRESLHRRLLRLGQAAGE